MRETCIYVGLITVLLGINFCDKNAIAATVPEQKSPPSDSQDLSGLTLGKSIQIALDNNRQRKISEIAIEIAEAQHKQALSAYWPKFAVNSAYNQLDQDPRFIFPAKTITSQTLVGPDTWISTTSRVSEERIKVMDRELTVSSLKMTYPIYAGGMRSAITKQAKSAVKVAEKEQVRTDLQIVYDTTRFYYGAVLAKTLYKIGENALAKLEATLNLTERMYKEGSGKVKKTDYLRHKVIVEGLRSMVAVLESNEKVAQAALVNCLGLPWNTMIEFPKQEIPFDPYEADLRKLIDNAYKFNPDWAKLKFGMQALEAKVQEAKSGYKPRIAVTGNRTHIDNSYRYGMVDSHNTDSWSLGIGMEFSIFDGFLTRNKVREARTRVRKLEQEKALLQEGLALQIEYLFLRMQGIQKQEAASKQAMQAAKENSQLNIRAYYDGLVEVQQVVEAQLMDSFMQAQYHKVLYDHIGIQAYLDFVIGEQVNTLLKNNLGSL